MTDRTLAGSALAAPAAGFGGYEQYSGFTSKVAVLLQALTSNHPLPDGNKRTALLCAVLFANLNGYRWEPPAGDDPDGEETAEVVEAVAARVLPRGALVAWVDHRLQEVASEEPDNEAPEPATVIYPAEYIGPLSYDGQSIRIGGLTVDDVHGYNPASVYVRRISGKTDGISVAEIIVSVVGDGYAQEELDQENAEADRYPLGQKEYWRSRMVGKYTYGADGHLMTDADFEMEWAQGEQA